MYNIFDRDTLYVKIIYNGQKINNIQHTMSLDIEVQFKKTHLKSKEYDIIPINVKIISIIKKYLRSTCNLQVPILT